MSRPHRYTVNPEFTNLEKFVWEGLNNIGRSIPQIGREENPVISGDESNTKSMNSPIWHSKAELDEYVARSLGINQDDYPKQKGKNPFYKAVANEVGRLRRAGILIDWKHLQKRNTGMGVWRLDKQKLETYADRRARSEIKKKNFYSSGSESMVYVRAKQDAFRSELLAEYGKKCALCGFMMPEYTIGAHIVPYSVMRVQEPQNAMNPSNGLLLCRFCDVAFENGTITVEQDLGISISELLRDRREEIIKRWIAPIPPELRIKKSAKYPPDSRFLKWKKDLLEIKEGHDRG